MASVTVSPTHSLAKTRRRWPRILLVTAGVIVLLLVGLRVYLSTASAANMAATRLSEMAGVPVHVKGISPGILSTGIEGVEIAEANGANDGRPWAVAKE